MGAHPTRTSSMWSACSWRESACGSATSRAHFRFTFRLDFGSRSSYFIRVSGRLLFRYAYVRVARGIHDKREDVHAMAVSTIADDKKKALNLAIAQIEKSCGKGSIMRMDAKE